MRIIVETKRGGLAITGVHHDSTDYITIKQINLDKISDIMYQEICNGNGLSDKELKTLRRYTKSLEVI